MAGTQIPITGTGQMADGTPISIAGTVSVRVGAAPGPSPGPVINVPAGADLQAAINAAPSGSVLSLAAGATFTGPFTLPNKPGGGLTLQSSSSLLLPIPLLDALLMDSGLTLPSSSLLLPPLGQRIAANYAPQMPKIVSPGSGAAALLTAPGAFGYQLIGLEVMPASPQAQVFDLIQLGDGSAAQTELSQVPHDLTLDRCYIHGTPGSFTKRGVALNSGQTTITGCLINEIHAVGQDSQAIAGWNGPGPYRIENNELQAAGENILFGGADAAIAGLTPADITIRRNLIHKDPAWRGGAYSIKNLIELKNAERVRIQGNDLAYNWLSSQTGFAVLVTVNGTVAATKISDVVITNNRISHVAAGIVVGPNSMAGGPVMPPPANIRITNNLLIDVSSVAWGGYGRFLQIATTNGLEITHNTCLSDGTTATFSGAPCPGFVMRDNLVGHGSYGLIGDDTAVGSATLARYAPGAVFLNNALAGAPTTDPFPTYYDAATRTLFPADWAGVGFVNLTAGDYHLAPSSAYHGQASDGTDIGCDIDALLAALGE